MDGKAHPMVAASGHRDEKMKIALITPGRFHTFDLAEQLQLANRLAGIYTGYPRFKLRNTRVDPDLIRSFPWFQTPFMALGRLPHPPQNILSAFAWRSMDAIDRFAARTLPDCALLSALSGSGLNVGRIMQRRGGVYVCDRGSSHIRFQDRILAEEYERLGLPWTGIDRRVIDKEEAEYATADAITVPSDFVLRSFTEMGVPSAKLHLVPYGVNFAAYRRTAERAANFRILFVGQISVRKGVHYLLEAFRIAKLPNAELILVGGRTSDTAALLPRQLPERTKWLDVLPQAGVVREMSLATVMVLPSIEDGLSLVQAQALACGCPVIATTNTGGENLFTDGHEGFIVPPRDPEALAERLTRLHRDPGLVRTMGDAALMRVKSIGGWDSYGRAMMGVFDGLIRAKSGAGSKSSASAPSAT
jgi:alpha-maltose-1-phosphate synthase